MNAVFADTVYWLAVFRPRDPWRGAALRAKEAAGSARVVTTDEVLTEVLDGVSGADPRVRARALRLVRGILARRDVQVIPQSRDSFLKGLELYEARPDKGYSLTDCTSMVAMRTASITHILTNDRHFQQEGFEILMAQKE
jgi:predicted nucleic acid-binding protein